METVIEELDVFHWLQGFTFDNTLHFARIVEFDFSFNLSFTSNNKEFEFELVEDDEDDEEEIDKVG